jgi:hypothetical protein
LSCFAESGLGEMDMINVGAFAGPGDFLIGLCCALSLNKGYRQQGKQRDSEDSGN